MPSLGELVAPRRMGRNFRWLLASSWTSVIAEPAKANHHALDLAHRRREAHDRIR